MPILLAALLSASIGASASASAAAPCTPIPGAERLWRPPTRWVIVGEMHGTNEEPAAFANLACLAAATGRPVTVAVEYSQDWQPALEAWLASDGGPAARAALLRMPLWHKPQQDGRSSVAFVHLFERLRVMKQAGTIRGVVAADAAWDGPAQDRDEVMARNWTAAEAPDNGLVLAYVGNAHAMRTTMSFDGVHQQVPAASRMPAGRTLTVNVVVNGGRLWDWEEDGPGVHPLDNGRTGRGPARIVFATDQDPARRFDATFELGVPATAALPAVPPGGASRPPAG